MAVWDNSNSGIGGGFYGQPGYKNPLPKDTPSWSGNYDWKGASKGTDWNSGFSFDKASTFSNLFGKATKYRDQGEQSRPTFGEAIQGKSSQVLENLGVVYPSQHAPMFIPGQQGEPSIGEKIARSAIGGTVGALTGGPAGAIMGGASPWFS